LNLKYDDLGRLNLRKHTIAKRSEYLAKRKDYEEKYILRYMKKLKAEPKRSSSKNLDHDLISGRLNLRAFVDKKRREIKTERTEYEKKYISKYKESKASIKKSKSLTESDDLGKFTISTKTTALKKLRAERAEYEKQYLVRYSKQRKAKPKKKVASSDLYKPETPKPKLDMKKERKEYEQKYLSRYKQPKTKSKKLSNLKYDIDLGTLTLRQYVNAKRKAKQDEIKEYERKYLSRYKQPKSRVKKPKSWTQSDVDLGRLALRPYINAKRKAKQDEIREYEKQFLSRYNVPKARLKSKGWAESDVDLGTLNLSQYVNAKRTAKQEEIKKYEKQYLARYKQPKSGVMKPKSWTESDVDLGKLTLRQYVNAKRTAKQEEIRKYEQKYLALYKEPKAVLKKSESYLHMPEEAKQDINKERKDYEKEYLAQYNKQQKSKPKKRASKPLELEPKPKRDINKERKDYEREYVSKFKKLQKTKLKIAALEQKLRLSQIELDEPKLSTKQKRGEYEKEYITRYSKQQKAKPKKKVFAIR